MKILFAVSNENVSAAIKREYQNNYKGILTTKNVYYFNAIIKELQNDKTYDVVVISEDLEPFANNNYDAIDKFLTGKLTDIKEESTKIDGADIPIVVITTDRHAAGDNLLARLYEIGIYNAVFGENRSVQKVCELIAKPRTKDIAKKDYKILNDSQSEDRDDNVKESEIKNIIAHYKKLGKSEEKYVESFDNIASQYSDPQLKVIIKFLPLNVKAVLEEQSPKYQGLMTFGQNYKRPVAVPKELGRIKEKEKKLETTADVLLEQLSDIKPDTSVVIPKNINSNIARKLDSKTIERPVQQVKEEVTLPGFEDLDELLEEDEVVIKEEPVVPVKKGRGRPRKTPIEEVPVNDEPKRRGRPRKVQEEPVVESIEENSFNDTNLFGLVEEDKISDIREDIIEEDFEMPGMETFNKMDDFIEEPVYEKINSSQPRNSVVQKSTSTYNYQNIESLVSRDKKIVSFVGTSKNGTSFIVNNTAQVLSSMNINTAILDMTKNRNSYYIYTQNDENLRQRANDSLEKLKAGRAEGIMVSKNLAVYTPNPTDMDTYEEADEILKTLIQNYSLVLIDCDFDTPLGYFDNSQEIYIVQSMDILTIQPLTAFLRDLKSKNILKQEKIRIIVNKAEKVRGLNEKVIVGGIAYYNDPSMSFMTELFDKNTVKTCVIPFDLQVYVKYLGTLVDCDMSLSGYPKGFLSNLKKLANMIYPLLSNNANNKYVPPTLNQFDRTPFTNEMDNTLSQMRNKY